MSVPCTIFCLPLIISSFIYKAFISWGKTETDEKKPCVVIFGASKSKALHYLRLFKDSRYRTVAAGSDFFVTCGTGWSIYCDRYYSVSAPLTRDTEEHYIDQVVEIVMREKADVVIQLEPRNTPSDVEANKIIGNLKPDCEILAFETETYSLLDNKITFNKKLHELGIRAPRSKVVSSERELMDCLNSEPDTRFILKPLQYLQEHRVNIEVPMDEQKLRKFIETKAISEERQFILQEKLVGPESCSCTLVVDSRIVAHNTCDQSVNRMWQNSIENPSVDDWVTEFLEKYDEPLTGFLTFDFMCSPKDGLPYPLECNPRAQTSHILFERDDNVIGELSKHLIDRSYTCAAIKPSFYKATFWLLREIALVLQSVLQLEIGTIVERIGVLLRGKEAVFEWLDPLPFLVLNFVQIPGRIIANLFGKQLIWNEVDYMCGNPLIN